MSLRDFIRATAKDVQAALKSAQEKEAEQTGTSAAGPTGAEEAEPTREAGEPSRKKKERKGGQPYEEEDRAQKRRRKERAQKTSHEEQLQKIVAALPLPDPSSEGETEGEAEFPMPPATGREGVVSVPVVEIYEEEEVTNRAGTSAEPMMYQPHWPNIQAGSMLNDPVLRAEWVARSLPPAELQAYARADTYDICDIANRAAIMSTIAACGMQRLLCEKDKQVAKAKQEHGKARAAYEEVDGWLTEALQRERNMEKEVERLRAEVGEMPSLKTQLAEAQAAAAQMHVEVEQLTAQGAAKDKEIENLHVAALKNAQHLASATGNLAAERNTRHYLMTSGIGEILSKVRVSHEYGKFIGGLVPKLQTLGKAELIKKMRHDYFPNVKPEDIPYFVPTAEEEAEEAFQKLRTEPFECHILNQLAANPDMTEEEIRNLKNPDLLEK